MNTRKIELNFTDYYITGVAHVVDWYGNKGTIEMDPFHVDTPYVESLEDIDFDAIKSSVNDGGFGVQKITMAEVDIYENYEGCCHMYKGSALIDMEV